MILRYNRIFRFIALLKIFLKKSCSSMTSGTTLYRFWAQCVQSFKLYLFLITLSYNTISAYIYKSHYSFKNSNLTTNPFGNVFWSCLFLIFTFKKFKSFKSIYISHCIANNDVTAKIIRQLGNHCDVWIEINLFIFKKKKSFLESCLQVLNIAVYFSYLYVIYVSVLLSGIWVELLPYSWRAKPLVLHNG